MARRRTPEPFRALIGVIYNREDAQAFFAEEFAVQFLEQEHGLAVLAVPSTLGTSIHSLAPSASHPLCITSSSANDS
jgi:hypothetical protein